MDGENQQLGVCQRCHEDIGEEDVLIGYEVGEKRRVWAECPSCSEVVNPG